MKSMRFTWGMNVNLLLILSAVVIVSGIKPEIVLSNILARPFVPREFASFECMRDSEIYLKALEKYTPWALQMFDASVKIPSGLITGNYKQLGNFNECLQVKNEHGFIGQACNAAVQFEITPYNKTYERELDMGDLLVNVAIASNATNWTSGSSVVYEWIFCVPSTCNHADLQEALEIALDPLKIEGRVDLTITVSKKSCYTIETVQITWEIADWCYISILVLFAIIIIASTGYDLTMQRRANISKSTGILTAFSLYKNGKELLRTDRRRGAICCLDGLRFISICWIIYGHTHYMEAVGVKLDLTQIPKMHYEWNNMLILNGNIVTDSFLLLSGILLSYTELYKKERDVKWSFSLIGLYVHRYVRLTPAYAMMIGFYATMFYKFGSGPQWDTWVGSNADYCRENWWTNLLYINNYVNVPNMCLSQSWYLSIDMQFVWLSPIILYPMLKFRRLFLGIVLAVCLFLSVLIPFLTTYTLQLTGTMLYYKKLMDLSQVYLEIYIKTYNRFGPYVIGLGLGYLLYNTRSSQVKLHSMFVIGGYLVAMVLGFLAIFGPRGMYFDNHIYNRLEASFYAGFHRQAFVLSISWIIFCCVHGYAGLINDLLCWRGWIPLSKLTYCAYLSHYLFILSHVGAARTTGDLTQMNVIRTFFANLIFTIITSAIWSLCFEMPFITMDNILFSQIYKRKQKTYDSTESNKDICQSKESSFTYDNSGICNVSCRDITKIQEDCDNNKKGITNKTDENIDKIFFINSAKHNWSNDKKSDKANVDDHNFDNCNQSKANGSLYEKESESTNNDCINTTKTNQSLTNSN